MTSNDPYPIRDAFRRFYPAYLEKHPHIPEEQRKTAFSIMHCKTGELGYNVSFCEDCGFYVIHAVSCNNRSCPCCQAANERKWEMERNTELIKGIPYFHVVFTVPHELNMLIRANKKLLLNLQFKCVQETLLTLCADPRFMGAKPGILSVLHTWGQKLNFHPHIHVCISGGGITPAGQFVETKHKGFFLPKAAMAAMFRGKYLCSLKKLYEKGALDLSQTEDLEERVSWKDFINRLFEKEWIPFIGETFNGRGNAVRYLTQVTFKYKDYADGGKQKELTVSGSDFISMFLQHILPKGFNRTRFSGYLTNCKKTKNLKLIHRLRSTVYPGNPYRDMKVAELLMTLYRRDICTCPECSGRMIRLPRGMPESMLPPQLMKHPSAAS